MEKKLIDIAEIQIGFPFRMGIDKYSPGDYRVIQLKDFNREGALDYNNLEPIHFNSMENKYLVKKNDIIFLSKGSRYFSALIEENIELVIPASYFTIIRPNIRIILPTFLNWVLNRKEIKYYFSKLQRGTMLPVISKDVIEGLRIFVPTMNIQSKVVELHTLWLKEKNLSQMKLEKRELLINQLCIKISKTETDGGNKK